MIEEFRVENFRCLEDVSLKLTPLHALVGPNDSGKSTIFRAMQLAFNLFKYKHIKKLKSYYDLAYAIANIDFKEKYPLFIIKKEETELFINEYNATCYSPPIKKNLVHSLAFIPSIIRWEPDTLRQSSRLIPNGDPINFLTNRGQGLPGIYDFILSRGDNSFQNISIGLCKLFPHMTQLRMIAVSESEKNLRFTLKNGQTIGVNEVSEGVLYFLAYSALQYIEPQNLLLIEEPENGLHPARIAEVMRILRHMTENGTQVILATHSPLVLNELKPEEITVLSRPEGQGTKATRLIDVFNFEERSKVFSPGEMWLNYCNGIDEKPLLEGADINGKKE